MKLLKIKFQNIMRAIFAIFSLTFVYAETDGKILAEDRSEMLREYRHGP